MPDYQGEVHKSENGDRWLLRSGRFCPAQSNLSSSGTKTKIQLGDFLGSGKAGPEHQAIIHLIGELVG